MGVLLKLLRPSSFYLCCSFCPTLPSVVLGSFPYLSAWIMVAFAVPCFSLLCLNSPVSSRANLANQLCCFTLNLAFPWQGFFKIISNSRSCLTFPSHIQPLLSQIPPLPPEFSFSSRCAETRAVIFTFLTPIKKTPGFSQ